MTSVPKEAKSLLAQCGEDAQSHPVEMVEGVARFVADPVISLIHSTGRIDLNSLWLSVDLDDQRMRKSLRRFYRDLGYSLCGYLEVFGEMLTEEEGR